MSTTDMQQRICQTTSASQADEYKLPQSTLKAGKERGEKTSSSSSSLLMGSDHNDLPITNLFNLSSDEDNDNNNSPLLEDELGGGKATTVASTRKRGGQFNPSSPPVMPRLNNARGRTHSTMMRPPIHKSTNSSVQNHNDGPISSTSTSLFHIESPPKRQRRMARTTAASGASDRTVRTMKLSPYKSPFRESHFTTSESLSPVHNSSSNTVATSTKINRRKKPSGYQQAGRDDSEEGRSDYNYRSFKFHSHSHHHAQPHPHATPSRRVLHNEPVKLTPRPNMNGTILFSPTANPSPYNLPIQQQRNVYPFSPNPFSSNYSPTPPPQHEQFGIRGNSMQFSPTQDHPQFDASVVSTPKKRRLLDFPRMEVDPSKSKDSTLTCATEASSPSTNCNMSVESSSLHQGPMSSGGTRSSSVSASASVGSSGTLRESNENCCDPSVPSRPSSLTFTGSPIREESNSASPSAESTSSATLVDTSFTSEPSPPAGTKKIPSIRSGKSFEENESGTTSVSSKFYRKRVSPTDVCTLPLPMPPTTPFKERTVTSRTPRNIYGHGYDSRDLYNSPPTQHDNNGYFLFNPSCETSTTPNNNYRMHTMHMPSPSSYSLSSSPHQFHQLTVAPAPPVISRFTSDFEEVGKLGIGSFGTVHKVMSRLDGCMYAIKISKRKVKGRSDRDRMLKEVYALASLCDHSHTGTFHIVRYHQAWMEENRLYIQTELCTSTLKEEIVSGILQRCLPRRYKVLREILLALELIHENNMVHLDIKPENIFIKGDQFKLGDFGLVSKATTDDDVEEGDSRYMSLELLSGDHVDLTKVSMMNTQYFCRFRNLNTCISDLI